MHKQLVAFLYLFVRVLGIVVSYINSALLLFAAVGSVILGLIFGFDQIIMLTILICSSMFALQVSQMVTPMKKLFNSVSRVLLSIVHHGVIVYFSGKIFLNFAVDQRDDGAVMPLTVGFLALFLANIAFTVFYILLLSTKSKKQFEEYELAYRHRRSFA